MESVVMGLAEALSARGSPTEVATLAPGPGRSPGALPILRLRSPRELLSHLRGFDVVHAHGLDALSFVLSLSRAGQGWGVSTHGAAGHQARGVLRQRARVRAGRWMLERAQGVWYTCPEDALRFGVPGQLLENGHHLRPWLDLGRDPEERRWVVPGRVDLHKGVDDLLLALGNSPPSVWPRELRLVGPILQPGLLRRALQRAPAALARRVVITGAVSAGRWREELARCSLALFPSRAEAFGLALLEALCAGAKVRASDLPAHRRLMAGESAWRLPPISASSPPLSDLEEGAPACGDRASLVGRWDWSTRVADYEAAYRKLLCA